MKEEKKFKPTLLFSPVLLSGEGGYPGNLITDENQQPISETDEFFDEE